MKGRVVVILTRAVAFPSCAARAFVIYTTIKNVVLGPRNIYAYAAHFRKAGVLNEQPHQ